jgi:hypothetical protein
MTRAVAHLAAQMVKPANLVPTRPGRTAPRARKRGGSHRYPRRKDNARPVRRVSHTIVLHPLKPPTPP